MAHFEWRRTKDDPGKAIILSFSGHWYEPLRTGKLSVVFRKMAPRFELDWIYAYLAAPIKAIVARARVTRCEHIDVDMAVALADCGAIAPDELRAYAKRWSQLWVLHIGEIEMAQSPVAYETLRNEYGYYQSSTYTPLSASGTAALDALARFTGSRKTGHRRG